MALFPLISQFQEQAKLGGNKSRQILWRDVDFYVDKQRAAAVAQDEADLVRDGRTT